VRPGRSSLSRAFATDEEECHAVDVMVAAASAVVRQNAQLRARLAALTTRHSGNTPAEDASAGVAASDPGALAADVTLSRKGRTPVAGGAKPMTSKRGGACAARSRAGGTGVCTGGDGDGDSDDDDDEEESDDDGTPAERAAAAYATRTRFTARRALAAAASGGRGETVLALGDLVATPYGRGVVLAQSDGGAAAARAPAVAVLLCWGARASVAAGQCALLAVAGEEFTGALADDAALLPPSFAVTRAPPRRRARDTPRAHSSHPHSTPPPASQTPSRRPPPACPSCTLTTSSSAPGPRPAALRRRRRRRRLRARRACRAQSPSARPGASPGRRRRGGARCRRRSRTASARSRASKRNP
jgi:hypothetical protein